MQIAPIALLLSTLLLAPVAWGQDSEPSPLPEGVQACPTLPGQLVRCLWVRDTGTSPKAVGFSRDGSELWVTLLIGPPGLEIYGLPGGARQARIPLGADGAVELAFPADGATVLASQMQTGSIYEVDRASRQVTRRLDSRQTWSKVIELSADGERAWLSNWVSSSVSEFDLASGSVKRTFKTVKTPRGLWASPDGARLYVAGFDSGELERIDLATGQRRVVYKGGVLRHLAGDPERGRLYISDMRRSQILVMDVDTEQVSLLASTDRNPNTITLSPDGRILFVSCRGRNNPKSYYLKGPEWGSVLLLDAVTGELLDAIIAGNQTTGLDVSPDGRYLAFSDILDSRIWLYEVPPYEELVAGGGGRGEAHRAELQKK